jgi:hypothetical protein
MTWRRFERKRSRPNFMVLSRHMTKGTEGNHEKPHLGLPVSGPRYGAGTYWIRRSVTHSTTTFRVYSGIAFIIVTVDFYRTETVRFKITCQLILFLSMKERNKHFSSYQILIITSEYYFSEYFSACGGDCSNLLPVLLSESDNCSSTVCTSTNSQRGASVKRSQQYKLAST